MKLVGGVVGAVLGSFMGQPQLGWAIGSMIGGLIEGPQKNYQEGARLTDLTVTNSNFGIGKPKVFGRKRIAGNVIRSTPRKEYSKTTTESNKGGGTETTTKTWHYKITVAYALCEHADAMTRMWIGGKLFYDKTISNSGLIGDIGGKVTFYKGDDTQLPDPALQRDFGVDEVSGYHGTCYVVFDNLELEEFGNNLPAIIFEVTSVPAGVDVQQAKFDVEDLTIESSAINGVFKYNHVNQFIYLAYMRTSGDYAINLKKIDAFTREILMERRLNYRTNIQNLNILDSGDLLINNVGNIGVGSESGWLVVDQDTLSAKGIIDVRNNKNWAGNTGLGFGSSFKTLPIRSQKFATIYQNVCQISKSSKNWAQIANFVISGDIFTLTSSSLCEINFAQIGASAQTSLTTNTNIYTVDENGSQSVNYFTAQDFLNNVYANLYLAKIENGIVTLNFKTVATNLGKNLISHDIFFDKVSRSIFILYSNGNVLRLSKFNVDNDAFDFDYRIEDSIGNPVNVTGMNPKFILDDKTRSLIFNFRETISTKRCIYYYQVDSNEKTVLPYELNNSWGNYIISNDFAPTYVSKIGAEIYGSNSIAGERKILISYGKRDVPQGYPLDKCVLEILKSEEYDRTILDNVTFDLNKVEVTELQSDIVEGYAIANPTSRRACLEQLAFVFDFYCVQSNFKLKFKKFNSGVVARIKFSELSAIQNSEDVNFETDLLTREKQEIEMPRIVNINYPSIERDYETSSQSSSLEYVFATDIFTSEVPIVMYDNDALNLSAKTLQRIHTNKDTYEFQTNYDYFYLEVGDVIEVVDEKAKATFVMRLAKKEMDAGIIKWQAISDDSAVFQQDNEAYSGGDRIQEITYNSQTKMYYLDIPAFTNDDLDTSSVYTGVIKSNKNGEWRGASILAGNENIGQFAEQATFFSQLISGTAVNKLDNFSLGGIVDTLNTVTVTLLNGELSIITENEFLNGYNLCLIGNELLQFKNATLIDENTYQLDTLLRGCRNTEKFMGNHGEGERFVMLTRDTDVMKKIFKDTTHLGERRYLKSVTLGELESSARAMEYVNTGNSLKPFSVNNIDSVTNFNGDKICKFNKSVRGYAPLQDLRDVYDPDGDFYEIEIYKDNTYSTVLRLLISTVLNFTYTNNEQIEDFGAPQTNIYIKIFKIGNKIGRGFEAKAII